jgi:hypothetical protein
LLSTSTSAACRTALASASDREPLDRDNSFVDLLPLSAKVGRHPHCIHPEPFISVSSGRHKALPNDTYRSVFTGPMRASTDYLI